MVLASVALAASYVPARRVLAVDPIAVLRPGDPVNVSYRLSSLALTAS